jgi:hypothetical protein
MRLRSAKLRLFAHQGNTRDRIPDRRYLHRQPRSPYGRRAESRQDRRVRSSDESGTPQLSTGTRREIEGQEFLVRPDHSRSAPHRASQCNPVFSSAYVQHHDEAYDWARRRKLEVHPTTGAAQLVELREIMQEIAFRAIVGPSPIECEGLAPPKPALFAHIPESDLLAYGVPSEWLQEVRKADEDSLFVLADHLPVEATEALIDLATGAKPRLAPTLSSSYDPFTHPDSERRFRAMRTPEDLERAFNERLGQVAKAEQRSEVPRSRRIQIQNQDDQAHAVLPVCDWVYFATSAPEDFVTTRNIVREFGMIIRTVFNSAGIRIANVQQVRQRDTILLVHGGGRTKVPYRPMFLVHGGCTELPSSQL